MYIQEVSVEDIAVLSLLGLLSAVTVGFVNLLYMMLNGVKA
jgi:hypothetical protein